MQHLTEIRILTEKKEMADYDEYELRHDSLAENIFNRMSEVEKDRLEAMHILENRYREYERRGALLDSDTLEYIQPFEKKLYLCQRRFDFLRKWVI